MKIKRIFRVSIFLLCCLFILVGIGGFSYIQMNMKPNDLRELITKKSKGIFPNSTLTMGRVDFTLRTSLNFVVRDVVLKRDHKSTNEILLSANEVKIKIPLITLVLGGGGIDVTFIEPEVLIGARTWDLKGSSLYSKTTKSDSRNVILPSFLASSTFDIRANDLTIRSSTNKSKTYTFDKFLLKKIGLKTNAAFELKSTINTSIYDQNISFQLTNIGSFSISNYLKTGKLVIDSNYKVKELTLSDGLRLGRVIHGGVSAALSSNGQITGKVSALAERSKAQFNYNWSTRGVFINDLSGDLIFTDFLNLLPNDIGFDYTLTSLSLGGEFNISDEKYHPNLNFKLSGLQQRVAETSFSHEISGNLKSDAIQIDLKSKGLEGLLKLNFDADFRLMSTDSIESRVKSYKAEVSIEGMKVDRRVYKEIYSRVSSLSSRVKSNFLIPTGVLKVNVVDSSLKKTPLSLSGQVRTKANLLQLKDFKISSNKGHATYNQEIKLFKSKVHLISLVEMKAFELETLFSLFPESRPQLTGKASGSLNYENKGRDIYSLDIKVGEGKFLNLNMNDEVLDMKNVFRNMPSIRPGKDAVYPALSNHFSKLVIKIKSVANVLQVRSLALVSKNGKILLEGSGTLSRNKRNSLRVFIKDELGFSRKWKKMTGTSKIPMLGKLTTKGFKLDEQFTVGQLSSRVIKRRGRDRAKKLLNKEKLVLTKNYGIKETKKILKGSF